MYNSTDLLSKLLEIDSTDINHIKHIKKVGYYDLQIVSDGQFSAVLSTKDTASNVKLKLLKFENNDTISKARLIKQ